MSTACTLPALQRALSSCAIALYAHCCHMHLCVLLWNFTFEQSERPSTYEDSELLLYRNQILSESGKVRVTLNC
jgi:hypothetical protein